MKTAFRLLYLEGDKLTIRTRHLERGMKTNLIPSDVQGGSNMTGTDLYVNKPHCAAAVRP